MSGGSNREREAPTAALAPYAASLGVQRGRRFPEPPALPRSEFQRDRDRVVHSRAFRRLEYKTQVFVHHGGDHYRNRLTHTLEGSQIARTIARALRLNEDLAEAVVLAHDLGHTPFGHAGEHALAALMRDEGGFDHNRQSLRVVDLLEERYPDFRGLNLSAETREGILKHGAPWQHPVALPARGEHPPLEAQVADHSDEIAYLIHDLDDGLRSKLLTLGLLEEVPLWRETRRGVCERLRDAEERVRRAQTLVALVDLLVTDLVEETARRVERVGAASVDDVRAAKEPLAGFSEPVHARKSALKEFLYENLYHHPSVRRMTEQAERVVSDLFRFYREDPARLPRRLATRMSEEGEARAVADYVAGMTDRFALAEHERRIAS